MTPADSFARRPWPTSLRLSAGVHAAALVTLALAPRRWPMVLGTLALDHAVLTVGGLWPRSRLLGPNLDRLPPPAEACGEVALTFDDGPNPEVTPRVLDLLDRYAARATFFCIGRRVECHPRLVGEIAARGHGVENHSHRHRNGFALLGPRRMAAEIDGAQEAIAGATGRRPAFFRPPAGFRNPWLEPLLARREMLLVSWTRRGYDTFDRDPDRVLGRLLGGLRGGDLLMLHDHNLVRPRKEVVLEVLPRLLAALHSRGLRSVALRQEHGARYLDEGPLSRDERVRGAG